MELCKARILAIYLGVFERQHEFVHVARRVAEAGVDFPCAPERAEIRGQAAIHSDKVTASRRVFLAYTSVKERRVTVENLAFQGGALRRVVSAHLRGGEGVIFERRRACVHACDVAVASLECLELPAEELVVRLFLGIVFALAAIIAGIRTGARARVVGVIVARAVATRSGLLPLVVAGGAVLAIAGLLRAGLPAAPGRVVIVR